MRNDVQDGVMVDSTSHQPSGGRETVLLVEDEEGVRAVASAMLRRHGYRVIEASTPGAACEIFGQRAAEVDLLLTDVMMPEMSGPSLAQRLVGTQPRLRVLFMSGYVAAGLPFDANDPNVSFLSKPFKTSSLIGKVQEILARPRTTA